MWGRGTPTAASPPLYGAEREASILRSREAGGAEIPTLRSRKARGEEAPNLRSREARGEKTAILRLRQAGGKETAVTGSRETGEEDPVRRSRETVGLFSAGKDTPTLALQGR